MTIDPKTLELLVRAAGAGQLGILVASALVPRVLDWRTALAPLPPQLRRLFWVYGVFIVLTITGFGLLTIFHARALAEGEPLARGLAGFICVFWGARLMVQFFVFDARPFLTNAWLRLGYHTLTAAFVALSLLFGWLALGPRG